MNTQFKGLLNILQSVLLRFKILLCLILTAHLSQDQHISQLP